MLVAKVTVRGARDVAHFLSRMIPTHCPTANAKEWEEVRDALYALSNDTDVIVSEDANRLLDRRNVRLPEYDRWLAESMNDQANEEGWCVSERDDGYLEIQRIDEAELFDTDTEAEEYIRKLAEADSEHHKIALLLDGTVWDKRLLALQEVGNRNEKLIVNVEKLVGIVRAFVNPVTKYHGIPVRLDMGCLREDAENLLKEIDNV